MAYTIQHKGLEMYFQEMKNTFMAGPYEKGEGLMLG